MQDLDINELLKIWLSGGVVTEYSFRGIPIIMLGRMGKMLQFISGSLLIMDLIGYKRLGEWGELLISQSHERHRYLVSGESKGWIASALRSSLLLIGGMFVLTSLDLFLTDHIRRVGRSRVSRRLLDWHVAVKAVLDEPINFIFGAESKLLAFVNFALAMLIYAKWRPPLVEDIHPVMLFALHFNFFIFYWMVITPVFVGVLIVMRAASVFVIRRMIGLAGWMLAYHSLKSSIIMFELVLLVVGFVLDLLAS